MDIVARLEQKLGVKKKTMIIVASVVGVVGIVAVPCLGLFIFEFAFGIFPKTEEQLLTQEVWQEAYDYEYQLLEPSLFSRENADKSATEFADFVVEIRELPREEREEHLKDGSRPWAGYYPNRIDRVDREIKLRE